MATENELSVILSLKDDFSKKLDGVQGKLKDFQPAFQKMAVAGTAAFGIITAIGVKSIEAFTTAEKDMIVATKGIDNALAAMSAKGLSSLQKEAGAGVDIFDHLKVKMNETAKAAIKLGFDDEEAAIAFSRLFQISGNVAQSQKDLKLAMDLSAFSGRSLEESVKAISMTYAGGGRILKEFGVQIDENATATDILNEAQKRVGGTAEETSKSFQVQMKILNTEFGNLQESIGAALAPMVLKLLDVIKPLLEQFTVWAEANPELLAKILLIGAAVSALVAGIGILGTVLPAIITGFTVLSGPIGLVALAIGGLSLIIYNLNEIMKILENDMGSVWIGIKEYFKEGVNFLIGLAEAWANSWVMAVNVIVGALNKIKVSVPSWVPGIGGKSFSVNIPSVPDVSLPRFEHGGVVQGAIGEAVPIMAHGQERILPASASAGDGGNYSYTVVINNPAVRSQSDLNDMRSEINSAMRDLIRVHKLQTI